MLYIKELPEAGGRLIYSGRRESIRTKGEFFMRKYIVKRLLLSVVILFCVSFIIYTLMRCLPGSFVETRAMQLSQGAGAKSYDEWMEQLNASYGLDKPIVLGFLTWVGDALKGNFGDSWKYTVPVFGQILRKLSGFSFIMGRDFLRAGADYCDPAGCYCCNQTVFQSGLSDYGGCIDRYFPADLLFATLLKLLFSVKLGWFDLYGLVGRNYAQLDSWGQFLDKANHLVLPIITLVIVSVGSLMRYTRTNMLEVLNADYIRTARAKDFPRKRLFITMRSVIP